MTAALRYTLKEVSDAYKTKQNRYVFKSGKVIVSQHVKIITLQFTELPYTSSVQVLTRVKLWGRCHLPPRIVRWESSTGSKPVMTWFDVCDIYYSWSMQVYTMLLSAEKDIDKDTQARSTEVCVCVRVLFRSFSDMVSDSAHGLHLVILSRFYNLIILMYGHSHLST